MITPAFGLTATERVLPKLALDFTTASLDSRVTFTRTTGASNPATYVNSSGYITEATNNQPRFDYDPVTLACKGLLIEESRTNLTTQSSNFTTTYYTASNAAVTGDAVVSPSNAVDADFLKEDGSNTTHFISKISPLTVTSGASYTFSIFAKANGRSWIRLNLSAGANLRAYFDLTNGVVGSKDAGVTSTITPYANGFYRCTLTATTASTSAVLQIHLASADGVVVYQGDNTSGVYLWGAQLEAGAFATSYIPTTTTALTRNADVATMTGTNFSSWFNAGNGAFGCLVLPKAASGVKPVLQCDDATALNTIVMQGDATATEMKITTLAVLQNTLSTGTITANAQYGLCGAWSAGSDALSKSGASPATGSPLTIPTVTQARLGSDGANYFNGWLKKINYWPMRVTNSETQAFSK